MYSTRGERYGDSWPRFEFELHEHLNQHDAGGPRGLLTIADTMQSLSYGDQTRLASIMPKEDRSTGDSLFPLPATARIVHL
jgi:hypothetical protein